MIELVKCNEGDIEKIEGLERRIFKPSEQYTLSFISWLCRSCSRFSFIAYDGDKPIGYIISCIDAPRQGHVVAVGLVKDYRGRGLGRKLMCASMCSLGNLVDRVVLEVRVSNSIAQGLYRDLGFQVRDQIRSYYSDGEDAYYMVMEEDDYRNALIKCGCEGRSGRNF
ncbi:MAG: GNAT family N-acetyltransferase [Thermocladium sp.]